MAVAVFSYTRLETPPWPLGVTAISLMLANVSVPTTKPLSVSRSPSFCSDSAGFVSAEIESTIVSRCVTGSTFAELVSTGDADALVRVVGMGILISVFWPKQFLILELKSTVAQSVRTTSKET